MDWGNWTTYWVLSEWAIRLVMLPVIVLRKERPSTCLAWLTLVFFAPWLGAILYLVVGETRLGRKRLQLRKSQWQSLESLNAPRVGSRLVTSDNSSSVPLELPDEDEDMPGQSAEMEGFQTAFHQRLSRRVEELLPGPLRSLADLGARITGFPATPDHEISYLSDSLLTIDRLIAEIDSATDHVHLLYYIFRDDVVGRRVAEALTRARQRGVACRVLVDAVGSRHMLRTLAPAMRRAGIDVRAALPVRIYRIPFSRIDLRNHRKIAIVDGRVAYVGSQNIVEPRYGHRKAGPWYDVTARIVGPAVHHLQLLFLEDWFYESGEWLDEPRFFPPISGGGNTILQILPSGPDLPTERFQDLLVKAIFLAEREIILTSPYFVPDEPLSLALRLAALRGVNVQLVLPRRSDHPIVDAAGEFHWRRLREFGVHVYFFPDGLLHAKTLTIDNQVALFGSANYDIRSFHLNFEVNLLIYTPDAVEELRELQKRYIERSKKSSPEDPPSPGWARNLAIHMAKLLSPLL